MVGLFGCYVSSTLSSVCYSLCLMLSQCCWYVHLCKWLLLSVFYHFTYNSVMISQVRLKFQPRVPFLLHEYPINLNPVTLHSFIHIILYSIPSALVTHEVEKNVLCLRGRSRGDPGGPWTPPSAFNFAHIIHVRAHYTRTCAA